MKKIALKKYFTNCFILILPILAWNIIFMNQLPKAFQPEVFWINIPNYIKYGENFSRILLFTLTVFMPLNICTRIQIRGLRLYIFGILLYFASWLFLIYLLETQASSNLIIFMAPAYTPIFWLTGIGLIGKSFYFNILYKKWFFISIAIIFLLFHNLHTYIIYLKTH
ncbi:MAG: hypothetical protein HC854_18265 [Flavobacterium sp.]|nr:hypothetical protein [Flavobacterium sp.]